MSNEIVSDNNCFAKWGICREPLILRELLEFVTKFIKIRFWSWKLKEYCPQVSKNITFCRGISLVPLEGVVASVLNTSFFFFDKQKWSIVWYHHLEQTLQCYCVKPNVVGCYLLMVLCDTGTRWCWCGVSCKTPWLSWNAFMKRLWRLWSQFASWFALTSICGIYGFR